MMNRILSLYFKLPHDRFFGLPSKIINRLAAKAVKKTLDSTVPKKFKMTQHLFPWGLNTEPRDRELLVSLTSFPARIADVWIVVECLFRQTYKADKIILWLDQERFTLASLPEDLKDQFDRGLEVRLVKDLRAHTKYFYALQEFKDANVVTVDDDCYYPETVIENLVKINKEFPDAIASNRIHKFTFNSNILLPYRKWYHNYNPPGIVNNKYLLTGVSGVLYPPNTFDNQVFDVDTFMQKCMFADDIWLSLNAFRLNVDIASNRCFNKDMISISKSSEVRLLDYNSKGSGNDDQIKAVLKHLGEGIIKPMSYDGI